MTKYKPVGKNHKVLISLGKWAKDHKVSSQTEKRIFSTHQDANLSYDKRNAQEKSNEIPFFGYETGKDHEV